MPLVSVIIPVFNGEKTIRETIDSVLQQTFQDFELLVINDGSQDATIEIVSSIKDSRIKIFSYPNAKQAASRNRGIERANGKFIAFLDADDLWTTDKLEAQLKALQDNPDAAVAYSWTNYIDESSNFIRPGGRIVANGNVYKKLFVLNFLENGSNPLMRKQVFNEVGVFDESLPPTEDWDMWLRLAARYDFVAVPSPQILYRVSANSASTNIWRLESACVQVIERAVMQSPDILRPLKKYSLGNIYKYLTYKALDGVPRWERGLMAIKFIVQATRNDPALLKKRIIWKVGLKIVTVVLFPSQLAQVLLAKMEKVSNLHALFAHLKTQLDSKEFS